MPPWRPSFGPGTKPGARQRVHPPRLQRHLPQPWYAGFRVPSSGWGRQLPPPGQMATFFGGGFQTRVDEIAKDKKWQAVAKDETDDTTILKEMYTLLSPKREDQLDAISTLEISWNLLASLPKGIGRFASLLAVRAHHNNIRSLDGKELLGWKRLRVLDLAFNSLNSLSSASLNEAFADLFIPRESRSHELPSGYYSIIILT